MKNWEVEYLDDEHCTPIVISGCREICTLETYYKDAEEHAYLIAALPELLAACENIVEQLKHLNHKPGKEPYFFKILRECSVKCGKAIKKSRVPESF